MNNWKSIWNGKRLETINLENSEYEIFCELKKTDGFDVGVGNEEVYYRAFYDAWQNMYQTCNRLVEGSIKSVYEVGCGCGVNLFLFQNRDIFQLGGVDYSASLVEIAKKVIRSDDLVCDEAKNINETEKYDFVMADSVFQYFKNLDYAEVVLRKMLQKANKLVYLGELHDNSLREEWLDNRRKSIENYDEIYAGLSRLFFDRKWVENIAADFDKQVLFTLSENPEYLSSKYIFNCFIY